MLPGAEFSLCVVWQPFPTLLFVPSFHCADVEVGNREEREREDDNFCESWVAQEFGQQLGNVQNAADVGRGLTYSPSLCVLLNLVCCS